jgi:S-adenosylmethionine hydrolase
VNPLITLTTDFGTRDPYVAAMKGVLMRRCPEATLVDLTHEIGPQDLMEAAIFLAAAVPYYPSATVHLVVVDPGVGTGRAPLLVEAGGWRFVCPDNGVLSLVLDQCRDFRAWEIMSPYAAVTPSVSAGAMPGMAAPGEGEHKLSATFHGRDLFAPAAAAAACGVPCDEFGPRAGSIARLSLPSVRVTPQESHGEVIRVDRFGNLITNIRIAEKEAEQVRRLGTVAVAGESIPVLRTYGEAEPGALLALRNSTGLLEVAVREGSAAQRLGVGRGARVSLTLR